jgi:hypothetical protein
MSLHICIRTHSPYCVPFLFVILSLLGLAEEDPRTISTVARAEMLADFPPTSKQRIFCSLYRVDFPSLHVTQSITHHWIRVPTGSGFFFFFGREKSG